MEVWSWRQAIQKSDLKSTVKHVLLNLSVYMNDLGESCYPTIAQQVLDTGLSKKTVIVAIQLAEEAGFLIKNKHGFSGQKWANNEYQAIYPQDFKLHKGGVIQGKRWCNSGQKVVYQLHPNSPYNSPYKKKYIKKGDLPSFIDPELWTDFLSMRKEKKSPLTDRGKKIAINKLSKFHDKGLDVNHIIETSIFHGWKGFFEPKESKQTAPNDTDDDIWAAIDRQKNDQTKLF